MNVGTSQKKTSTGFTIVELLIVIVVIGILAAITIVGYNGVTSRAKASNAQAATQQAYKKVLTFATDNSDDYPADLASVGVMNTAETTYQYRYNNVDTPHTFCVTTTYQNVSYYQNNTTQTSPTAGACTGHGVNGVAPISNLAVNPSVEANANTYGTVSWGTSGAGSTGPSAVVAYSGNQSYRSLWTAAGAAGSAITTPFANVTAGQSYSFTAYIRSNKAINVTPAVRFMTGANNSGTFTDVAGSATAVPANTWTRVSNTQTVPAGNLSAYLRIANNTAMAINDVIYIDAVMTTPGSTVPVYADGASAGWAWSSTAHNSISTGPAL